MELNVGVVDRIVDQIVQGEKDILIVVRTEVADLHLTAVGAVQDPVQQADHPVTLILTVLVPRAVLVLPNIPNRVLLTKKTMISNPNSKWRNRMESSPCLSKKPTNCVPVSVSLR